MRNLLLCMGLTILGWGCTESPEGSNLIANTNYSQILDHSLSERARIRADGEFAESHEKSDPERVRGLEKIFLGPDSDGLRLFALGQLVSLDRARTVRDVALTLPTLDSWPLLTRTCAVAAELGNPELMDPLIESLARPATTLARRARPEAGALERLGQQPLEEVLQARLMESRRTAARVGALDLLAELQSAAVVKQFVLSAQQKNTGDDLLDSWQWWARAFDALPGGAQETAWVRELHAAADQKWVQRALTRHQVLKEQGDYLAAPRFVATLAYADEGYVALTREALLAEIAQKLATHATARRQPDYPGAPDDYVDTLPANAAKLSRCDLLNMEMLLDALNAPAFRREILKQGTADRADKMTEHGGLLIFQDDSLGPILYPPLYASSDRAYITSDKLLADSPTAMAQFHFHFQETDNGTNAGPGRGDMEYAAQTHCSAVVFTSISQNSFDVHYYTPSGAVLGLRVWRE